MAFDPRPPGLWQLKSRSIALGERTVVMGILNITPDSFSGDGLLGSRGDCPDHAVDRGLQMLADGAAILDIGGESTRPGQREAVTAEEELARVLPVIRGILQQQTDATLSIDTYKAATARAAVHAGAEIVNDVSGFLWDEEMAAACAELSCGVVLTHTRGRPDEWKSLPRLTAAEVVPRVKSDLRDRLTRALSAGVQGQNIVLDPGIGFGKAFESNYPLLARLGELKELGHPLLSGVSRKSFLGRTLAELRGGQDAEPAQRGNATLAAITASILAGAEIIRVHEVRAAAEAAAIADAVLRSSSF